MMLYASRQTAPIESTSAGWIDMPPTRWNGTP